MNQWWVFWCGWSACIWLWQALALYWTWIWDNNKFSTIASGTWAHLRCLLDHWSFLYPRLIHSKADTPSDLSPSKCSRGEKSALFPGHSVHPLPADRTLWKMQWLEACWRNSRNQEQRNERSHFNQLSCDLDQTRIFSYSVLQREGGHQQLSFISDSHILSLPPPAISPPVLSSPYLSFISLLKHQKLLFKKSKLLSSKFLPVCSCLSYPCHSLQPSHWGPQRKKEGIWLPSSNFISFSMRPAFSLTSLLMLKSSYLNLNPSPTSICKIFEDLT